MLIIANWKMNPLTLKEAYKILNFYKKLRFNIWIAPPSLFLIDLIKKYPEFKFGVQNIYFEKSGSYTGEISPWMVENLGIHFVIINHSERRKLKESLKIANLKLKATLKTNLTAVVCFGENKKIKKLKNIFKKWERDFSILFKDIALNKFNKRIIIAYEPSWAISTNKIGPVPPFKVNLFIKWIRKKFNGSLLYGGSIFPDNIQNYLDLNLDGFLIGSSSLSQKDFKKIIEKIKNYSIIK